MSDRLAGWFVVLIVALAGFGVAMGSAAAEPSYAHRWTEAVATKQVTLFIRKWQCSTSAKWSCDVVIPPILFKYGAHSWQWRRGVYYYQSFGGTVRQCESWGVIVSHDIRDGAGNLVRKGNAVYNYGHKC